MESQPWQLEMKWVGLWLHSAAIGRPGSAVKALAVQPFNRIAPRIATGVVTHCGIGGGGIHMGHLFPQLLRRPAHRVQHPIVFDYVAPTAATALLTEQLLNPLVAQHQHRVGIEDKLRFLAEIPRCSSCSGCRK